MILGEDNHAWNSVIQNPGIQNVGNQNELIVVPWIANQNVNPNENGNVVAARAEGNANGNNGIQIQAKEFDLIAATGDLDEIEEVNTNYILMANLHMEQSGGTIEQYLATVEETRAYFESLYNNLAIKVEKVNSVNHKIKETNAELTIELARYKNQEKLAVESLDKITISKKENECLFRAVVSQDIMPIVQSPSVVETSDLQTELERNKERINPSKNYRDNKFVPINQAKASVRTKPIIVSQPHVITKKDVNFDTNGLSSTGVDNTAKTRMPQPRSNTKIDRVSSVSKSSCIKNNEVEVEEHHRNLLLSKYQKHMSSECNNVKLAIRNDKSEVVCAMCKQCLITTNHDVCVLNYVDDINSCADNQNAKVSNIANFQKHKAKVKKSKKLGSKDRLASPKPRNPRTCLRWSPTGRIFDFSGKLIESSDSEYQSDCSNGDNACASNLQEKRSPNSTSFLGRNDHILVILAYGDLQWGNILVERVYYVKGLGDNLFSIRQFFDLDLEVAFRRNTYFVKNLKRVNLLNENSTTNFYIINLHEMASASPICIMARATSTKSWLWHQRLFHLNFDNINDLAKNDLVSGLPKFKYLKEYLFPSCEQGKSKTSPHKPKPVPNSKQMLHLLHMDLCMPMRVESINGKRYVLVIVDDYSRYTWVYFLRSKDEAPEVIKTFLKKIQVLLQALVIIIRPTMEHNLQIRNQTLVEAVRTMLIFSCALLFLWAEAIATACYTQNYSLIHQKLNKTSYELINGRKLDISFLHVFKALCYPKNDREDIRKLSAKELALTYAPSTITSQKATESNQNLQTPNASTTNAKSTLIPTNTSSQAANTPNTSQEVDEIQSQPQHVQQQDNHQPLQSDAVAEN
ncbi:retrovirus-related pol polyprotein from transposon TNT 1-94, partial [Tanacetum coccineum]